MRIPTDHFRNVPVVLLSPSLMNSPCTSNTPSPSHHAHGGASSHGQSSLVDESFPRSLMERLMRPEIDKKVYFSNLKKAEKYFYMIQKCFENEPNLYLRT